MTTMTRGQRLAVRVLAFALRRRPDRAAELKTALWRAFPHRTDLEREVIWQGVLDRRAGISD